MMVNNEKIGLKGQIDCLFLCEVEECLSGEKYKCVLPFELKTGGKKKALYEDQSLFYCLLLNQKYRNGRNLEGFLYYLCFNEVISLSPLRQRTHSLIVRRNKLAKMIKAMETKGELPPINHLRPDICKFCYEKEACYSSQIATDLDVISDIEDLANNYRLGSDFADFHSLLDSMTEGSKKYLQHWLALIQQEQQFDRFQRKARTVKLLSDLEDELSFVAQNFGDYFTTLTARNGMPSSQLQNQMKNAQESNNQSSGLLLLIKRFSDLNKMIGASEHYKEGESFVLWQPDIKSKFKAIIAEKELKEDSNMLILKFKPIQEDISFEEKKTKMVLSQQIGHFLKWSVENYQKDQYPDQRQNVLNLILNRVANQSSQHEHLIKTYNLKQSNNGLISAVVDFQHPSFKNREYSIDQILQKFPQLLKNQDQADAIKKVLSSDSLTCVLGMPGTGKTFLIAHLIKILAQENRYVLVTSFTNSALDNIIIKTLEIFPELKDVCLRRGSNKNLIHPRCLDILYMPTAFRLQTQFSNYFAKKRIFFSTIIGANNKLFHSGKVYFDFCIIDEASQCVEPLCLGPMLQCRKSVLIGDHNQLQPLVKCDQAGKAGLSISLFERMCLKYPGCVTELRSQFRMNESIMELSNIMVYKGKLKAFDSSIGDRKLILPNEQRVDIECIRQSLDPNKPVVFLDTSNSEVEEESFGQSFEIRNKSQISLIIELLIRLQEQGVNQHQIAVITPYNAHRVLILKILLQIGFCHDNLDIFTVDKSQGIDKDTVILHIPNKLGGEHLLQNWRRMNVALTRAKVKLIIIGNKSTIMQYPIVSNLLNLLASKEYIHSVSEEDHRQVSMNLSQIATTCFSQM